MSKKFLKTGSILSIASLLSALLALITQLILSIRLTPEEYGVLSVILSISTIVGALATLGVPTWLVRTIGAGQIINRDPKNQRSIFNLFIIGFLASIVSSFFLISYIDVADKSHITIIFSVVIFVGYSYPEVLICIMQIKVNLRGMAFWTIFGNVSRFIVVIIVAFYSGGVDEIVILLGLISTFLLIYTVLILRKFLNEYTAQIKKNELEVHQCLESVDKCTKDIAAESIPLAVSSFLFLVVAHGGTLVVAHYLGAQAAGAVSLASYILVASHILPNVIIQRMLFVRMSRLATQRELSELKKLILSGCGVFCVLGLGVMIGIQSFSYIIDWKTIVNETVSEATKYLLLLSIGLPARYVSIVLGGVLVSSNHSLLRLFLQFSVSVYFVISCSMMALSFGVLGVLISFVSTEWLFFLGYLFLCKKLVFKHDSILKWNLNYKLILKSY